MVRKNPKVRVVKTKNTRGDTRSSGISRGRRSTSVAAITSRLRRR